MDFVEKIKNSIYNPTFYRNIPKESFGAALKYYILLCLLVTFFRLVFLSFPIIKSINYVVHAFEVGVVQKYPNDLQITIHHGKLTVNQPQPYVFPVCFDRTPCLDIVIDTKKPDIEKHLKQKKLLMLLTQDNIYLKDDTSSTKSYSFSLFDDITINKTFVANLPRQIALWVIVFVAPVVILLTGIMLYLLFFLKLVYLLVLAVILWLLAKKFAPGMTNGQSYKISLHVVTLGIFVALFLDITSWFFHIYSFPFMETIFSILVYIINFNTAGTKITKTTKKKK